MTTEGAQGILEGDFLSPERIRLALGMEYTGDQIALLENELPNDYKLRQCREQGVMLVAGPAKPMSLAEIMRQDTPVFGDSAAVWATCSNQFAQTAAINPGWMLFNKQPVPDSDRMSWHDARDLVVQPKFVPNVAEVAWAILVQKMVNGEFLFPDEYVRTSTSPAVGLHVAIGHCGSDNRALIQSFDDDECRSWVKLAQAQTKFSR